MALFSFGKRPKPKKFGFKPRYYDQDKEELQARLAKYDKDLDSAELIKTRIKSGFAYKSRSNNESYRSASRKSNYRLLLIIGVICMVAYQLIMSDTLYNLLKTILG
jgi:hypothetical protein